MIKDREYQICNRCVMDTTDRLITFDNNGYCNHCTDALKNLIALKGKAKNEAKSQLDQLTNKIKAQGLGKKYDCVIGLSGGVDSSYLAHIVVKEMGLRPLAIHVDNGWNSELAVINIESLVKKLNLDLYTWVIDWTEFRDLQKAYLKASVVDLEVLSDNAIVIAIDRVMRKFSIKYFLIGFNFQAESIMPASWLYSPKFDGLNIRTIYKKYGSGKALRTFPTLRFPGYIKYRYFNRTIQANILDMVPYVKAEVIPFLEKEYNWKDYGGKHFESRITKFYQSYILPRKFNIDKRKAHLSSLIVSGQISREFALQELTKPLLTEAEADEDLAFFLKKLNIPEDEFRSIMEFPAKDHFSYSSYNKILSVLSSIISHVRRSNSKPKN